MKKLKWIAVALVITLASAPAAIAQCQTFSSPCYFYIEEDFCRTWSCTYCDTLQCCHVQAGYCINPYGGTGYLQYCDQYCAGSTKG